MLYGSTDDVPGGHGRDEAGRSDEEREISDLELRIQNLRTLYTIRVLQRDRATDVLRELVRVHSLGEHCSEGDVRTAWSAARDLLAEGAK